MAETLYRSAPGLSVPADGRTMVGWAVPFRQIVDIFDPFDGAFREQFVPGAFTKTLAQRSHKVRLLLSHDRTQLPLGTIVKLEERSQGLWLEASLADTAAGRDVQALARDGHDLGMSIGFQPVPGGDEITHDRTSDLPLVTRREVKLLEVSVTAMSAYPDAEVVGVRSLRTDAPLLSLARRRLSLLERS